MKDFIFIHIPKTAGQSIQSVLGKYDQSLIGVGLHRRVSQYSFRRRANSFSFTFVRNPFERLASGYFYLKNGLGNKFDNEVGKILPDTFKEFAISIKSFKDRLHFRKLDYWIDGYIDFVGCFENLQQDFSKVCSMIGVPAEKLPHINKSLASAYMKEYDSEMIESVTEVYLDDLNFYDKIRKKSRMG